MRHASFKIMRCMKWKYVYAKINIPYHNFNISSWYFNLTFVQITTLNETFSDTVSSSCQHAAWDSSDCLFQNCLQFLNVTGSSFVH